MIKFTDAILCEGVRREDNGKLILLGVYTGSVTFGSFPAAAQFLLYAIGEAGSSGNFEFEFEVFMGRRLIQNLKGNVESVVPGKIYIPFPTNSIQFEEPSTLHVKQVIRAHGARIKKRKFFSIHCGTADEMKRMLDGN